MAGADGGGPKGGSFRTGFVSGAVEVSPQPPYSQQPWSHWVSADKCDLVPNGHTHYHFRRSGISLASQLGLKPHVPEPGYILQTDLAFQGRAFQGAEQDSPINPEDRRCWSSSHSCGTRGFQPRCWAPQESRQWQHSAPWLAVEESQEALSSALSQLEWSLPRKPALPGGQLALWPGKNHVYRLEKAKRLSPLPSLEVQERLLSTM